MYGKSKLPSHLFYPLAALLILFSAGCDESSQERRSKQETERKERIAQQKEIISMEIAALEKRYDAIYFPPKQINASSYTYEIQDFFASTSSKPHIFPAFIEDIVRTPTKLLGEFTVVFGDIFLRPQNIRLRLVVPENKVRQLLEAKPGDSIFSFIRYYGKSDFWIIANVTEVQKLRRLEFEGSAQGDEIEIEQSEAKGLIFSGQLIEAIPRSDK